MIKILIFYCDNLFTMFYKNNGDLFASGAHPLGINKTFQCFYKDNNINSIWSKSNDLYIYK